ncbi:MAG: nitrogen fixation protein NifH [Ardenticatenaceae bacterium]|nr:nitrogen fixation protein NifH [Ardenticatenaceae bacterium]MCB9444490.1 nitrogen fixation protein NifH [Ardenticatenaceae bacterium]
MNWWERLNGDPLSWLLEVDGANPGVRYFALKELLARPLTDPDLIAAQKAVMETGPVPIILKNQEPDGYWVKPGPGYYPKYTGTVWQIIFLAQLGADGRDTRVKAAGEYLLEQARAPNGGFSMDAKQTGEVHCLEGNLAAALLDLGWLGDERLAEALDWLARSITGEGIAPAEERDAPVRYYRSGNSGPCFQCSANDHQPCAWGAVKAMLALSKVPPAQRTPAIQAAIETGIDFLLGRDPAVADYPTWNDQKPSQSWFRFGFPVFYVTDVLQNLEVLMALGYGQDARLKPAIELLLSYQDGNGRWPMKYTYNSKTWTDIEAKNQPSKWVTLRALRVLKRVDLGRG